MFHVQRLATTNLVKQLNDTAIINNMNRALSDECISRLDPSGVHVIVPMMIHEHAAGVKVEPHVRCQVLLKMTGSTDPAIGWLDVVDADFKALPKAATDDD